MSVNVHISDTHAENINIHVEMNNGESLSWWQRFKHDHPKMSIALCLSGIAIVGGVLGYGTYQITKTPPLGKNSPRSHVRKDGVEKVGYKTKERANAQALYAKVRYGEDMNSYKCQVCDKYHVGHDYTSKSD